MAKRAGQSCPEAGQARARRAGRAIFRRLVGTGDILRDITRLATLFQGRALPGRAGPKLPIRQPRNDHPGVSDPQALKSVIEVLGSL